MTAAILSSPPWHLWSDDYTLWNTCRTKRVHLFLCFYLIMMLAATLRPWQDFLCLLLCLWRNRVWTFITLCSHTKVANYSFVNMKSDCRCVAWVQMGKHALLCFWLEPSGQFETRKFAIQFWHNTIRSSAVFCIFEQIRYNPNTIILFLWGCKLSLTCLRCYVKLLPQEAASHNPKTL